MDSQKKVANPFFRKNVGEHNALKPIYTKTCCDHKVFAFKWARLFPESMYIDYLECQNHI